MFSAVSIYVHQTPDADELSAIRRSNETGLPYGEQGWLDRLAKRLKIDLTIRPRGRPKSDRMDIK
jgi:putative transposase